MSSQKHNLMKEPGYAETAAALKEKMYAKMAAISDTFENNTYYEQNWVEDRLIKRTATLHD